MICLQNVYWQRERKRGHSVLHDITFTVQQGGFRWLLGPSGAGKSSLLTLLNLESLPLKGHMNVLNKSVSPEAPRSALIKLRQRIGMVHQDYNLIHDLSVFDNVALPLRLQRQPEHEVKAEVNAILDWVGLGPRMNTPAASLSGGEQQRTAIARAIVHHPEIILADEPTNALEESQAHRLLNLFDQLNSMGTTILVATHNEALVRRLPRPSFYLENGRLTCEGD